MEVILTDTTTIETNNALKQQLASSRALLEANRAVVAANYGLLPASAAKLGVAA